MLELGHISFFLSLRCYAMVYPTSPTPPLCPCRLLSHLEEEWAVAERREQWLLVGLPSSSTITTAGARPPLPTPVLSQPCMSGRQCHQRCPAALASFSTKSCLPAPSPRTPQENSGKDLLPSLHASLLALPCL